MPVVEQRRDVPLVQVAQALHAFAQWRLDGDDLHVGLVLFQEATRAHERATGAQARHEVGHLGAVAQDLGAGVLVVRPRVGVVRVLVEEAPFRIGLGHLDGPRHGAVAALFARREDDLGAEDLEHLTTLDGNAGGHEDLDGVTLDLRDGGERDTGVARRGFDDGLTRDQTTVLLGVLDHGLGDAVLHRTEGVLALELGEQTHARVRRQPADVDQGRVPDQVENAFVRDHAHLQPADVGTNSLPRHSEL